MPMVLSSKETSRIGLGSSGEVGRACESFTLIEKEGLIMFLNVSSS